MIDEAIRADTQARHDDRALDWANAPLHDIHDRLMDAVQAGERSRTPDLARLCATVLDIWPTLWNFIEHPDAQGTNNRAEVRDPPRRAVAQDQQRHPQRRRRALRRTHPQHPRTCRLNDQPLHDYLVGVHTARLTGQPIPTPRCPPPPRRLSQAQPRGGT